LLVQEITLPEMRCAKATNEEKDLIKSTMKFDEFMRTSCYYLEPDAPKKSNSQSTC
jgi:DNA-directed RNA polymerase III subunit RPC7